MTGLPPHLSSGMAGLSSLQKPRLRRDVPIFAFNMRFEVLQLHSSGSTLLRALQVNEELGTLRFESLDNTESLYETFSLMLVSRVDESALDRRRISIAFFSGIQEAYELLFCDPSSRDAFCDLLATLNPSILFRRSRTPVWVPDDYTDHCMHCKTAFTMTNRKHHCRHCGRLVCGGCSSNVAVLPHLGYRKPVRVCDGCLLMISDQRVAQGMGRDASDGKVSKEKFIDGFSLPRKLSMNAPGAVSEEQVKMFEKGYERDIIKQRENWSRYLAARAILENRKSSRRLARAGIPPELRGYIWQIACGAGERKKRFYPDYYEVLLENAQIRQSPLLKDIEKDLHRTFPDHPFFSTVEGVGSLRRVLWAFTEYSPKVGYCQSMNFIAALLLFFMTEEEAFWTLCCIIEDIACVTSEHVQTPLYFHQNNLAGVRLDLKVFAVLVKEKLPRVHRKLEDLGVDLEPLALNWFLCLFVHALPLETTLRVWDCVFFYGCRMLFRAALTLLKTHEKLILAAKDVEQLMAALKSCCIGVLDCNLFMKSCFEYTWIGSLSKHKLKELRNRYIEVFVNHNPEEENDGWTLISDTEIKANECIAEKSYNVEESSSRSSEVRD